MVIENYMTRGMLLLFALLLSFNPTLGRAETPEQLTAQVIERIKKNHSLDGEIAQPDWETAFRAMSPKDREERGIKTVEDYKKSYQDVGAQVRTSIEDAIKTDPSRQGSRLGMMLKRVNESASAQKVAQEQAFAETEYVIGPVTLKDGVAQVELLKKRRGKQVTTKVEFKKEGGNWKMVSTAPFSPPPSAFSPSLIARAAESEPAAPPADNSALRGGDSPSPPQ